MIPGAVLAAIRQVASPALRRIALRSFGLTLVLLLAVWGLLTKAFGVLLERHPVSADYPVVDGFIFFMAGAGLVVLLAYLLPPVSAFVGGFFLDRAAEVVETTDYPSDPPGRDMATGRSVLFGLRFGALALALNLAALTLFFIPVVNVAAFFSVNAYLLGREYFEMAAARFRSPAAAADLRRANRTTVLGAGALLAGLMLVPILNLLTPIFGITLMVHLHKRIAHRAALRAPHSPTAIE